jgi:hypothetical protein
MDARTTSPTGGGSEERPESARGPEGEREPRSADDKRYIRTLTAVYVTLLLTAFSVAVWAQRVEHDFTTAATALGAVFLLVPTVEVVAKRDDRRDATQHRAAFLKAFGLAAVPALIAWLALGLLPDDVTGRTELRDATLRSGAAAELVVGSAPDGHDELSVTLEVRETAGGGTSCIPGSELRFDGQDLAEPVTVETDRELTVTLPLDAAGPGVSSDITLLAAEGCEVTLVSKQTRYR